MAHLEIIDLYSLAKNTLSVRAKLHTDIPLTPPFDMVYYFSIDKHGVVTLYEVRGLSGIGAGVVQQKNQRVNPETLKMLKERFKQKFGREFVYE
jgi:hypothetical protein